MYIYLLIYLFIILYIQEVIIEEKKTFDISEKFLREYGVNFHPHKLLYLYIFLSKIN